MVSLSYYGFAFFICILLGLLMILYNYLFSDMKRQKKLLDEKENKLLRLYQSVEDALDDFNDAVERSHSDIEVKLKDLGNLYAEVERGTRGLAGNIPSAARFDRAPAAPPQPVPRMAPPQAVRAPVQAAAAQRPMAPPQAPPVAAQRPVAPAPVAQAPAPAVSQPAPAAAQAQPAAQAPVRQAPPPAESIADSIGQAAATIRATAPGPAPAAPQARPEEQAGPARQTMAPPPAFRRVMEVAEQVPPSPAPAPVGRNELIISMASEGRTRSQIAKELGITLSEVDLVIGMNK